MPMTHGKNMLAELKGQFDTPDEYMPDEYINALEGLYLDCSSQLDECAAKLEKANRIDYNKFSKTVKHLEKVTENISQVNKLGLIDIGGSFIEEIHLAYESLLSEFDPLDWVLWFAFETEFGKKPQEIRVGETTHIIDSFDSLVKVINENDKAE